MFNVQPWCHARADPLPRSLQPFGSAIAFFHAAALILLAGLPASSPLVISIVSFAKYNANAWLRTGDLWYAMLPRVLAGASHDDEIAPAKRVVFGFAPSIGF